MGSSNWVRFRRGDLFFRFCLIFVDEPVRRYIRRTIRTSLDVSILREPQPRKVEVFHEGNVFTGRYGATFTGGEICPNNSFQTFVLTVYDGTYLEASRQIYDIWFKCLAGA